MDLIKSARELGKSIQEQECYIALKEAEKKADADTELQNLIGEFNLKRMAINNEAQKSDRDEQKVQKLNEEMREVYSKIMSNENMKNYNESKTELDSLVQRVIAIISQCSQGADPETADLSEGCSGSCSTCSGCH